MKPFKTHRQQLAILKSRGLTICDDSKALQVLERENYYGVINGYKDFFLQTDQNRKLIIPDKYKPGSTFEGIYKLFSFDRDLSNISLEYLLKFESSIKSKVSYRFSEKFEEPHAYLILKNFSRDPAKLKTILKLISTISNTISNRSNTGNPIEHYLDKHAGVPLWVLVHYLTLGNMQYFYTCLDSSLQNIIARDFAIAYKQDYGRNIHITPEIIECILKTTTFFRNVCAHEDRLYNFKLRKPARSSNIATIMNIPTSKLGKGNLFTVFSFLQLVLPINEHKTLLRSIKNLFCRYSTDFSSVNFSDVLKVMGFDPLNWENYFS